MLSYIYRLCCNFESQHGYLPNRLYINPDHLEHLLEAIDEKYTIEKVSELLKLSLIVNPDIVHPYVVWTQVAQRRIA